VYKGKIIDFHVHIGKIENWHPWVIEYLSKINTTLFQNFDEFATPENFEKYLSIEGIECAVILAEDSPLTTGVVTNEYICDFCKGRKKFIPFASINPLTTANPEKALEKCIRDMGFKGLKLYPSYQHFYPNDKKIYPLYEIALQDDIPVMFHTGSSIYKNSKLKYADPMHLDEVAADFPELKIVMAHSGRGFWYEQAFFISRLHKNLYMEISGLPPKKLLEYFPEFEKNADKIIFGSDWPGVKSIKENINALVNLGLNDSSIKKILYDNAKKILG
jgi:predicted TIM-barrel fold metal-dependent hydrolase